MEKRQAIIQAATALFGSIGFDGTTTLAIADEASVTEPLIYYHFKGKDDLFTHSLELAFNEYLARLDKLPKRTATEFQKITAIIDLHFQIVDDLPEQTRLIITTCPAKLYDPNNICRKKYAKARKRLSNYIKGCLTRGVKKGEFNKLSISETTHMLLALINGLLRQRVFQLADTDPDGVKDATIEFCSRSLVESVS
jgi:AcrR family transcriptional regulator